MKKLIPLFIVFAFAACSPNNVKEDPSIGAIFTKHGLTGNFGLFDNGQGNFILYNKSDFKDSTYVPASTFKVFLSLVAVETGRVSDEKTVFPYNGVPSSQDVWNKDMRFDEALKTSSEPVFREVATMIGLDTLQRWIDSVGYGQRYGKSKIKSAPDCWHDGSIRVTSDEQLGFVKMLYFDQLLFQKRTQRMVRTMLLQESNTAYQLSYKTGLHIEPDGKASGWFIGWIEENRHPYFFALHMKGQSADQIMNARLDLLKDILRQQGFLEGKR